MKYDKVQNKQEGSCGAHHSRTYCIAYIGNVFTGCQQKAKTATFKVTFEVSGGGGGTPPTPTYVQVSYIRLKNYLLNTASADKVNYIEITGISKEDFAGTGIANPGELCKRLKVAPTKKVALKIQTYPADLTTMRFCFASCENLVELANLPASVETMPRCFAGCTELTAVPDIPANVRIMINCFKDCTKLTGVKLTCDYNPELISGTHAFSGAFKDCTALTDGGIKVPEAYYGNYTDATALTTMSVPGADTAAQKAKFGKY